MQDGWHKYEDAFPGLKSPALIDEVFFYRGKPVGRIEQFVENDPCYANDIRGRLGAITDAAAAREEIERRILRVVE